MRLGEETWVVVAARREGARWSLVVPSISFVGLLHGPAVEGSNLVFKPWTGFIGYVPTPTVFGNAEEGADGHEREKCVVSSP